MSKKVPKIYAYLDIYCKPKIVDAIGMICQDDGMIGAEHTPMSDGRVHVRAYFAGATGADAAIKKLAGPSWAGVALRRGKLREKDWLAKFRRRQKPLRIGKSLIVSPTRNVRRGARHLIHIPLERAFGTGSHETTRGCIEAIEEMLEPGGMLLDVGTGSGVLAIAAAKLGAGRVDAIEIDAEAAGIARANVRRNRVTRKVNVIEGDLTACPAGRYDIVVANLTSDVIIANMDALAGRVRPGGGRAIFSGILAGRQADAVMGYMRACPLTIVENRVIGEWAVIVASLEK